MPVRTSTDFSSGEGQGLAAGEDLAGRAEAGASLPSTQTLSQARPPLIVTTRLTPLYATVTFRVSDAVLPSAEVAVTVIAQRPAVSSSGAA